MCRSLFLEDFLSFRSELAKSLNIFIIYLFNLIYAKVADFFTAFSSTASVILIHCICYVLLCKNL